ncbi:MAG: universal stress protein [Actinomycetes bacterium]
MSNADIATVASDLGGHGVAVQRLLFVADAAVADVDELPPAVRGVLDAATEVHVLTPTLPGRLAWLTDDVDRCRHIADERLDTVLGHMRSIGVAASGRPRRGSVLTVIADAVADFTPDHILIALRSTEHANWQEHGLIKQIEERFGLPVTTYAVNMDGHTAGANGPLLLCYDGSADAAHAIQRTGELFAGRTALVLTVWQPVAALASIAASGAPAATVDVTELALEAEEGRRVADEGVRVASQAGLTAAPLPIEAGGPVWKTILELAEQHGAAMIVMGSRGLTGLRSLLLGSVSSAVAERADRPTLIIRRSAAAAWSGSAIRARR